MNRLHILTGLLLLALACPALAETNPVGKWNGKTIIDESKMPKDPTPQQSKMLVQIVKITRATKFALDMKPDKTWTMDVTISVPGQDGKTRQQQHHLDGSWHKERASTMLKTLHEDGKPSTDKREQVLEPKGASQMIIRAPKDAKSQFIAGLIFSRAGGRKH